MLKQNQLQELLEELQGELIGKEFTLGELENEVVGIIGPENHDSANGPGNYSRSEVEGGFAFGRTEEQNGVFNVQYNIVQDSEEINDIVVRVKDVEII